METIMAQYHYRGSVIETPWSSHIVVVDVLFTIKTSKWTFHGVRAANTKRRAWDWPELEHLLWVFDDGRGLRLWEDCHQRPYTSDGQSTHEIESIIGYYQSATGNIYTGVKWRDYDCPTWEFDEEIQDIQMDVIDSFSDEHTLLFVLAYLVAHLVSSSSSQWSDHPLVTIFPFPMAIIDELGIRVTVVVDDAALTEYEDPKREKNDEHQAIRSHKYVASHDNKEFSISIASTENLKWAKQKVDFGLSFEVLIDGREVDYFVVTPKELEYGSFNYQVEGLVEQSRGDDSTTLRKCRFSPIVLVDNANEARTTDDTQLRRDVGLIRVLVFRERILTDSQSSTDCGGSPSPTPSRCSHSPEAQEVAEENVKGMAVTHMTLFSQAVDKSSNSYARIDTETLDASPLAEFRFKYRSQETLEDLFVLRRPRDLYAGDACHTTQIDQLTKSEILRLAMERLEQKQRVATKAEPGQQALIKRGFSDFDDTADTPDESRERKQYNVTADGDFDIVPWKGPAWEGYVERCDYYFDGGLQGPFDCTGPNPDFEAKSVIIQRGNGHCASMSYSSYGTKGYRELWDDSDSDSACYDWYDDAEGIRCWD
ncbi:hypothetical protein HJFPF1_13584 [Paramyrothecium foliicola]|nr:hypothetical protein HJFPF1_13584 [Paramyrothecium foliicola]